MGLPVKKNNRNIFFFFFSEWEGPSFSIIFSYSSGQKKGKKKYSSSPSLREVLYFHQNFVLLSVEKEEEKKYSASPSLRGVLLKYSFFPFLSGGSFISNYFFFFFFLSKK